jgi:hypothetical protein
MVSGWFEIDTREILGKNYFPSSSLLTPTLDRRLAVFEAANNVAHIVITRPLC